jgi:hypothetical protein
LIGSESAYKPLMPTFHLITTPEQQWAGLTNNTMQKLPFALKELTDNTFAASIAGDLDLVIKITEEGDRYLIIVSDSGPGITPEQLPSVLALGHAKRAGLNEHGYGLKNVLAFCCRANMPGQWVLITLPTGSPVAYQVSGPWTSPMNYEEVDASQHPYSSGVTIRMYTPVDVLRCYPGCTTGKPKIETLVKYLVHCMGVTYAYHPMMTHTTRQLRFRINDVLVRPEKPETVRVALGPIRKEVALMEGAPVVLIELLHLRLDAPNTGAMEYYKRNMPSSGVYLFFHGRLIVRIPPGVLYGLSVISHNDYNPFICIVNVTGNPAGIPPTITTKNGLIETNPLTQGLMEFIREHVPHANARDPKIDGRDRSEAELVREYVNRTDAILRDIPGCSIQENKTYPMGNGENTPPFDIVERKGNTVTITEAKKHALDMHAVGQIWQNVALARDVPEFAGLKIEARLVCRTKETSTLFKTVMEKYKAIDPAFVCHVRTWAELGIGTAN